MSRKPLGKDKFGVQKVMRARDFFGDATGQFALNAISGLIGQLTYFYTDKVGMAAGATATVFMICKILDAFTDVIMGNIVDHTKPGKEKYRPWMLKAGIPAGIMIAAIFMVPSGIGTAGQLAYAMITNLLLSAIFYTAVAIPYGALMTVRTNSQEERGKMGTFRAASGYISGMIIAIATIPITNMLGGDQSAWIKYGFVFGLITVLAFLIVYLTSRESAVEVGNEAASAVQTETETEEDPVPFKEALGKLFRNKYWVIVLVVNFLSCVIYGLSSGAGTYYCKWIFGNDNLVGILGGIGLIPTFIGFIALTPMIKKLGVVKTLLFSFAIGMCANAVQIVVNVFLGQNIFGLYAILGCLSTFATIPMMALVGVMTSMAIDYNEYKYGSKMVATSHSASSFGGKVGSGIGASIIGWMLGAAGYDATLAVAPQATRMAIYGFSFIVPFLMFLAMFLVVSRFDLEKKLPELKAEMDAKKAN